MAAKSNRTESVPFAPEFGDLLAATPVEARTGFVFNPLNKWGRRVARDVAGRTISAIGKKANVKTWTHPKTGKVKTCTAHDLRRSFGTRWATIVMPPTLQQMMRHAHLSTTMTYYVTRNAVAAGDLIRDAVKNSRLGNTSGNTAQISTPDDATTTCRNSLQRK